MDVVSARDEFGECMSPDKTACARDENATLSRKVHGRSTRYSEYSIIPALARPTSSCVREIVNFKNSNDLQARNGHYEVAAPGANLRHSVQHLFFQIPRQNE